MRKLGQYAGCVAIALGMASGAGCATTKGDAQPATVKSGDEEVAAPPASSVTPEQLEAIDMLFHRKAAQLQYDCYDPEVERTHQKFEGNVSISLVVVPGGKAEEVKLIHSSVRSTDAKKSEAPNIATCVLEAVKTWEWPDVTGRAPYMGSINFKPAW